MQDVEELVPRFRHNAAARADRFGGELAGGDGVVATEDLDGADVAGEAGRVFVGVRFGAEAGECAGAEADLVGASGVAFPGARRREGLEVHGGPPVSIVEGEIHLCRDGRVTLRGDQVVGQG